jgi:hypothetical protein
LPHAFCHLYCNYGVAAGFRLGSEGAHERVQRPGRRRSGRPAGRVCARDDDEPRRLSERVRATWSFERSMRQRLPTGPLPPRSRAAVLRGEVDARIRRRGSGRSEWWYPDNLSQFRHWTGTAGVVWTRHGSHLCSGTRIDVVRRRTGCRAGIRHRAFLRRLCRQSRQRRKAWDRISVTNKDMCLKTAGESYVYLAKCLGSVQGR